MQFDFKARKFSQWIMIECICKGSGKFGENIVGFNVFVTNLKRFFLMQINYPSVSLSEDFKLNQNKTKRRIYNVSNIR